MARDFDDSSSHVISYGTSCNLLDTATSCSISFWMWLDDTSSEHKIVCEWGVGGNADSWLAVVGTDGKIAFAIRDNANGALIHAKRANVSIGTGSWKHVVITWAASGETWRFYYDGVLQTTENWISGGTILSIKAGNSNLKIGVADDGGFFDGKVAEVGVWRNTVLNAAQANSLGKGFSPAFYKSGLVFYTPLIGRSSTESDLRQGFAGTITGAAQFTHPRIIYPSNTQIFSVPSVASGTEYTKDFSETLTITEPTFMRAFTRMPIETITLSEPVFSKDTTRTLAETITITDTFTKIRNQFRTYTESLTITDTLSYIQNRFKSFTETVTITDSISRSYTRLLTDTSTITDTLATIQGRFKSFTEGLTITDSIERAFTRLHAETITMSEVFARAKTRVFTETVTITDIFSKISDSAIEFLETITITDSIQRAFTRIHAETVTITDTFEQNFQLFKEFTETITITDTINNIFILIRNFTDTITVKDWLWRWKRNVVNLFTKQNPTAGDWTKQNNVNGTWTTKGDYDFETEWS